MPTLDRRIGDLEKTAPPARRRPPGMSSDEFIAHVLQAATSVGGSVADFIAEFREWKDVMTREELLMLCDAITTESQRRWPAS